MSIVFGGILVLMYAAAFAVRFRRTVCEMLIPGLVSPIAVLYLFGLLNFRNCLLLGYGVAALLGIALFLLTVKKRGFSSLYKEAELLHGVGIFVILLLVALIMNYGMRIHIWDEFAFWAMKLKYIFTYNALPIYTEASAWALLPQAYYPPGTALLVYLFSVTGFSEWKALFAQQVILMVLLTPFIKDLFKRTRSLRCSIFIIAWMLIYGIPPMTYGTLIVDSLVGLLFGFALSYYIVFKEDSDEYGLLISSSIIVMLSLTKDVGLLFALGTCVVFLIDGLFFKAGKRRMLYRLIPLLLVCILYFSWDTYVKTLELPQLGYIDFDKVLSLFTRGSSSTLEEWQRLVRWNMLFEILPKRPVLAGGSYIGIVLLFLLFCLAYSAVKKSFKRDMTWSLIIIMGAGFYAFFLLYVHGVIAGPWDGPRFSSYERYAMSYLISMPMIAFMLLFPKERVVFSGLSKAITIRENNNDSLIVTLQKKQLKPLPFLIMAVAITLYSFKVIPANQPFAFVTNMEYFETSLYNEAEKFIPALADGELTLLMTPGETGSSYYQLRYATAAPNVNILDGSFSVGEEPYYPEMDDPWTLIVTAREWGDWIKSYNIKKMLLWDATPEFIESYGAMFPGGVEPHSLYEVDGSGDSVVFQKLEV